MLKAEDYRDVILPALERAAASGEVRFCVRDSGKSGSSKWVYIWKLENGKVQSYEQFNDPGLSHAFS